MRCGKTINWFLDESYKKKKKKKIHKNNFAGFLHLDFFKFWKYLNSFRAKIVSNFVGHRKWFIAKHFDRDKMGQETMQSERKRLRTRTEKKNKSVCAIKPFDKAKRHKTSNDVSKRYETKFLETEHFSGTKIVRCEEGDSAEETKHLEKGVIGHFHFIRSFVML